MQNGNSYVEYPYQLKKMKETFVTTDFVRTIVSVLVNGSCPGAVLV